MFVDLVVLFSGIFRLVDLVLGVLSMVGFWLVGCLIVACWVWVLCYSFVEGGICGCLGVGFARVLLGWVCGCFGCFLDFLRTVC